MLKLIVLSGVFTIIVFFIANIVFLKLHSLLGYRLLHDFESLVLIYAIISVLGVFVSPLHNAVSRKLEKDADLFALNLTGDKNVFISTMKKLAEQNLIDPSPNKFYEIMLYNHPPISRRISFAESFKRET